jgi:hypothetical protein
MQGALLKLSAASCGEASILREQYHSSFARLPRSKLRGMRWLSNSRKLPVIISIILSIMRFVAYVAPLFRLVKGKVSELYSINLNINNIDNIVNNICLPANALFF